MLSIGVSIGEVTTDIQTDIVLSFDAIDTLLRRATESTLDAYNRYVVAESDLESLSEDDDT